MKATIIETQRWSLNDGPGIRTVIFLKGCPLKCSWCANPESQKVNPQIGIFAGRCVNCEACTSKCPEKVAIPAKSGAFNSSGNCTQCGDCTQVCHSEARSWLGEEMTVEQMVNLVRKDMVFFRNSNGGVTFSGGEPLLSPGFLEKAIEACQVLGIHTVIETCGFFNWQQAQKTIENIDLVMFDIKHIDSSKHESLTGKGNEKILENAINISKKGTPMVIRVPVIPSLNDNLMNIKKIAEFVHDNLPSAIGMELLPYHRLGLNKYEAIGIPYQLTDIEPPDADLIKKLQKAVTMAGVHCITEENNQISDSKNRIA